MWRSRTRALIALIAAAGVAGITGAGLCVQTLDADWSVRYVRPAASASSGTASAAVSIHRLPPGPIQEKAEKACLGCHDAGIILQQQLDQRLWTREMDKMIRWGAPVAAEDRAALIAYFSEHFSPQAAETAAASLPEGPGAEQVRSNCLTCHSAVIIVQQRLDRAAWSNEIEKMIALGASVPETDREILLRYLTAHFPAAPPARK
jgi:cytochrome c5